MNKPELEPTIRRLRGQLIQARQLRDMALLREIEEALVYLGNCQYRCCLVDYSRETVSYYVRLLGYDQARVKVQIEFPIAPELGSIQWVPLSHLADYSEVDKPGHIRRMRNEVGAFIQRDAVVLARSSPLLLRRGGRPPKRGYKRAVLPQLTNGAQVVVVVYRRGFNCFLFNGCSDCRKMNGFFLLCIITAPKWLWQWLAI